MNTYRQADYLDLVSGKARGPVAVAGRACLALAACGYAIGATARNVAFDLGIRKESRCERPVVSIGNFTAGGTGKTPMVELVARHYRGMGLRVAILSRGYGAAPDGGLNDEGLLLDQNLPDVPHLQGPDRFGLARTAVDELESEVLILDDGHQHRSLARDLNIVLVDATNPFGFGWTLPRGLLREPLRQAAHRADVIVLTRADLVSPSGIESIRDRLRPLLKPDAPWCESVHRPRDLLFADGTTAELKSIEGRSAVIFCGLGNPAAFRKTVESLGVRVIDERTFPDHHRYSSAELAELSRWAGTASADLVLTSQKDSVKLPVERLGGKPLAAIRIAMDVVSGSGELYEALNRVVRSD